jgi:hypothetical protein
LVVLIWIAVVGMLALVLARWRVLDHLITVLTLGLLPLAILDTARLAADRAHSRGQWFIGWTLLWMSIAAMTICAAKLGRIAGYAVWGVNDV